MAPEMAYGQCYGSIAPEAAVTLRARRVLMADLAAGDVVLTATLDGTLASTRVLANQHRAKSARAPMLTLHTATAAVSLTPDHAIFVDGVLAAASEAKVGSHLTDAAGATAEIVQITVAETPQLIINPVTLSATLLAADEGGAPVLAASHPVWIAPTLLGSPSARAVVNAVLFFVGDVDSIMEGLTKVTAALALILLVGRVVGRKAASSA